MVYGFWKLLVVGVAAGIALHRSGLWRHPALRALLSPTTSTRRAEAARIGRRGDRLYWLLVVTAAAAVAAWVVTLTILKTSPGLLTR